MIKKAILTLALSLFSFTATNAECDAKFCNGKIKRLVINDSGISIRTDGNHSNLNCAATNGYVQLHNSHIQFDRIYAMLLTAASTNQQITIRIDEGSTNCTVQYTYMDFPQ